MILAALIITAPLHIAPMPTTKRAQYQRAVCPLEVEVCQEKARRDFFRRALRLSDIV